MTQSMTNTKRFFWAFIALLFAILPPGTANGKSSLSPVQLNWADSLQAGADRLTALQNDDGGWDWPLDDGDPTSPSPLNTVGPIAMGLSRAYQVTNDPTHYAALQKAGGLLLSKTNNFSPSDGYLAVALDNIFGGTTYTDHVKTNFYDPLANGTYDRNGAGTLYNTASYVALIRDARQSQGIPNLAAWDLGMGLVAAASIGADTAPWIAGVKAEIDELDANGYYDVIGLAGAIYGLALVNEDFDPTAGAHAAATSLADLANILVSYQISSGGFTWNSGFVSPGNEVIQETAYAMLALNQFDSATYASQIQAAADYLKTAQLATGGWGNYGENNEITGEALWALSYEQVSIPGVQYDSQTVPANNAILTTGPKTISVHFTEDVVHDGSPVAANTPINYLLFESGANGTFDTTSCATPGGGAVAADDVKITINTVTYDPTTFVATLSINNGLRLPIGKYRLLVCGTTSIENFAGVKINNGLSDSTITFTVRAEPESLPTTGFSPGRVTALPQQPDAIAYTDTNMTIEIPRLNISAPIVGIPQTENGWDVSWLNNAVGYLYGSAYPTWEGNTVLTGHVWDASNNPGIFAKVKDLHYGDQILIHAWGMTYTYEVRERTLVRPHRVNTVLRHEEKDWVTLVTCEWYNPISDSYLFRRVIRAVLVSVK